MRHIDSAEGGSVEDMIAAAADVVSNAPMTAEEIQKSLAEAGRLIIELSKKSPSAGYSTREGVREAPAQGHNAAQPFGASPVSSIADDTRDRMLQHAEHPLGDSGDYVGSKPADDAVVSGRESGEARSTDRVQSGGHSRSQEYFDDFGGRNEASDYFTAEGGGHSHQRLATLDEFAEERMQRLIDEAVALLNDSTWSAEYSDMYPDETRAAIEAARSAINELKYPGGFSKNPLKSAKTVRNILRFVAGNHANAVHEAERALYPAVIDRAVAVVRARGNAYNMDQLIAEVEAVAKSLLPASFQVGGGWKSELKRALRDAVHTGSGAEDEFFANTGPGSAGAADEYFGQ